MITFRNVIILAGCILVVSACATQTYRSDNPRTGVTRSDDPFFDVRTHAYRAVDAYQNRDYRKAREELELAMQMLSSHGFYSDQEKLAFLDGHYPPADWEISYGQIARELLGTDSNDDQTAVSPGGVTENSDSGGSDGDSQVEVDDPVDEGSIVDDAQLDPRGTPLRSGQNYFRGGLHQFIQQEIRQVAIHMGEPEDFVLPQDFVSEIEFYIRRFQTEPHYRKLFRNALRRSRKYIPALKQYFTEKGFPEEIMYLAFIESGFNPVARSRSNAVGLFQFIKSTGKMYGLTINRYRDERYSPIKSAIACREYLHDLLLELGSFTMALSSYNSGAGRTRRALRQLDDFKDRSFWALREKTQILRRETRAYVPQIFAAIVMAKPGNPPEFGFQDIPFPEPYRYETVVVPSSMSLSRLSKAGGATVAQILALNPDLEPDARSTPPKVLDYPLFVPRGTGDKIKAEIEQFRKKHAAIAARKRANKTSVAGSSRFHTVRRGETLSGIARRYKVSISQLKTWNRLNGSRIFAGQRLQVSAPKPKTNTKRASVSKLPKPGHISRKTGVLVEQSIKRGESFYYLVVPGNSLSEIASLFGVSIRKIRDWNGLRSSVIRAGQRLKIVSNKSMKFYKYAVQKGDTLEGIAKRFGARISSLRLVNNKQGNLLRVGEVLNIFTI